MTVVASRLDMHTHEVVCNCAVLGCVRAMPTYFASCEGEKG